MVAHYSGFEVREQLFVFSEIVRHVVMLEEILDFLVRSALPLQDCDLFDQVEGEGISC
jgi:hypothetical protein